MERIFSLVVFSSVTGLSLSRVASMLFYLGRKRHLALQITNGRKGLLKGMYALMTGAGVGLLYLISIDKLFGYTAWAVFVAVLAGGIFVEWHVNLSGNAFLAAAGSSRRGRKNNC